MLFVCLSLTINPSYMNMQIVLRDWMTINPGFWLWSR